MKKFQKLFVAGTSLLIVCFMAVAGVFAFGTIARDIKITIHFSLDMGIDVWAATYSAEDEKQYYQKIETHDATDFLMDEATNPSIMLVDQDDETEADFIERIENFELNAGFKFDKEGIFEVYFLIRNHETNEMQYWTEVTFGDGTNEVKYIELLENEVSGDVDETKSTLLGTRDEANLVPVAEETETAGVYDPGLSLVKLVFNIKDRAMTPSFDEADFEIINIELNIGRVETN